MSSAAKPNRSITYAQALEISEQRQIMLQRFTETDSGIKRDAHGINAAL